MWNNRYLSGMLLVLLALTSCNEESDTLKSYAFNDNMAFSEAKKSFGAKFDVMWRGLSQNYGLWDYEREHGLDWDAVYDEFKPQFEALDSQKVVTDDELRTLVRQVVSPLHDGHFVVQMQNHKTGGFIVVNPNALRNAERPDYAISSGFVPILSAYGSTETGGNGDILFSQEASTVPNDIYLSLMHTRGKGYQWAMAEFVRLALQEEHSEMDLFRMTGLRNFCNELKALQGVAAPSDISRFNDLVARYEYLKIPGLEPIDSRFSQEGINVKFALFKGNIAYFYLSAFGLSPYVDDNVTRQKFRGASRHTESQILEIRRVWTLWQENMQRLHREGQLGGVIIDLRSNGGGYFSDYSFVLGSLLPEGDHTIGYSRFKRGIGRYDYSTQTPLLITALKEPHEAITEPVAVLTNVRSVSMSELTAQYTKKYDNMRLVGTRTWGGLCGLNTVDDYSLDYSGSVGQIDVPPVFLYIPTLVLTTCYGQIAEGVGVEPDIEVGFDLELFRSTFHDSQLDRALQYVRTGN